MMPLLYRLLLGFLIATAIALAAYRARSLALSGALAAGVMGTLIYGLGGLPWAVLLLAFFISSSGLSRLFRAGKQDLATRFEKGTQRDWAQVLANGGLGIFLVIAQQLYPGADWPWLAYAGSLAAVNADTWATEIGVLSQQAPRLVTTFKPVGRGASGGITPLGTFAALSGALLIGLLAGWFRPSIPWGFTILAVTLGGFLGSLLDSLLGATLQAMYRDPHSGQETERMAFDEDGQPLPPLRGLAGFNNDVVNFLAALMGALAAAAITALLL
jgi:uncharacterized protein (TIGR00297 family)